MAEFSFTGRGGGKQTLDTSTGRQTGGTGQWNVAPGGIYTKTGASGENVWIDPRTKTARDDPMEGQLTGRGGGQFFVDPKGFRLTQTGDLWRSGEAASVGPGQAQRVLGAEGDSPYRQVLFGNDQAYIDEFGVMRSGAMPTWTGGAGQPTSGAATGAPILGDVARGGAPGYPSVGPGGLIGGGAGGAPGPTTQAGTPGQGPIQAATPYVMGQVQPVTPQPTASAILSDPIQSRLQQLQAPDEQRAAQVGMTDQMDVNWQLDRILQADNPIINRSMEQARRDVQTEMNARGLSNTSMAVEMAEKAAWDAAYNVALPMASEAAKAEQAMASANLQSRASFQQTGMQLSSQETQQRASLASNEILQNLTNNNQITLKEIDRITQLQGIQLTEENKRYLTDVTEKNKLALQTNASVATAYSNTVSAIGQAYSNPEMNPQQQNAAAKWYMGQFEGYTKFQDVVNNTNYTEQMNWSGYTTTVAGAGQAQKTPGSYGPFGVVGAPGETRTATAPSRSGGQETFTFTWNQDTKNWDQAALSNREMEQRKRLQFS